MGTVNSSLNSSEIKNQYEHKQVGGKQIIDVDVSCLDSDYNINRQMRHEEFQTGNVGTEAGTETDTVNTEDFINLLKSKISNLTINSNSTNIDKINEDDNTSSEYLSTIHFLPTTQNVSSKQIGGGDYNDNDTDIDTIMRVAKEYLHQHGGGDDDSDEDLDDSDEDLDDSDEDEDEDDSDEDEDDSNEDEDDKSSSEKSLSSSKKKSAFKSVKRSEKGKTLKRQQRNANALSDSVSSESIDDSQEYGMSSSETFGGSESSIAETPYVKDSESINTSSINLVSFENPALTTNLKKIKKSKKSKK